MCNFNAKHLALNYVWLIELPPLLCCEQLVVQSAFFNENVLENLFLIDYHEDIALQTFDDYWFCRYPTNPSLGFYIPTLAHYFGFDNSSAACQAMD